MRADEQIRLEDAREILKDALDSYEGSPIHVTVYCLDRAMSRNDLLSSLARTEHPSDAREVKQMTQAVRDHLEDTLRTELDIKE